MISFEMESLLIFLILAVGISVEGTEGEKHCTIQNSGDGLFLTNLKANDARCTPLSNVTTESLLKDNPSSQNWAVSNWISVGFVLMGQSKMNDITYDETYPPYCYPLMNGWVFGEDEKNPPKVIPTEPTLLKNTKKGKCLVSQGPGRTITYANCDSNVKTQLWTLKEL